MTITVKRILKTHQELDTAWKEAQRAQRQALDATKGLSDESHAAYEKLLAAIDVCDRAWSELHDRSTVLLDFARNRCASLACVVVTGTLDYMKALDEIYISDQSHTFDSIMTEEEFRHLFDGVEDREAEQEWQDRTITELYQEPAFVAEGWAAESADDLAAAEHSDAASYEESNRD